MSRVALVQRPGDALDGRPVGLQHSDGFRQCALDNGNASSVQRITRFELLWLERARRLSARPIKRVTGIDRQAVETHIVTIAVPLNLRLR
jgi:hypothetical protein